MRGSVMLLFLLIASPPASAVGAFAASSPDKAGVFVYGACVNLPSMSDATSCAMKACRAKAKLSQLCKVEAGFAIGRTLAIVPTKGGRASVQLADTADEAIAEAIDGCKAEFEDAGSDVCLYSRVEVFTEGAEKSEPSESGPVKHAESAESPFVATTSPSR